MSWLDRFDITAVISVLGFGWIAGNQIQKSIVGLRTSAGEGWILFTFLSIVAFAH
jgi:hypothetical protein